jgi:8-oxo-dGTP pyrophosphatase MutT (NUDIX family)
VAEFIIPFDRLPERFAESVAKPPAEPVTARPAATLVLLRDAEAGLEVLLLQRTRAAGFVPGAYVFPGGRVDGADASPSLIARLDGLAADAAALRLELPDGDPPALAYYLGALREAFEETGILVAHDADGHAPSTAAEDADVDGLRDALMEHRITFEEVLDQLACRLDGAAVEYMAHWITPEVEPRRYDTRFFAAHVPPGARVAVDPREMTDAVWITPTAALKRHHDGSLPMVFPTIRTLEDLAGFPSVDAVLADLRTRRIPAILPRLVVTPTGVGLEVDP